jgi:hypothetical protein
LLGERLGFLGKALASWGASSAEGFCYALKVNDSLQGDNVRAEARTYPEGNGKRLPRSIVAAASEPQVLRLRFSR